jgi:hypothetical protein
VLGLHYLVSNVLSIGLLTVLRYALATRWIWRPSPPADEERGSIESASL